MGVFRKYFSVYQSFLSTSVSEATSFRAHFVLEIVMDLIFYATTLGTIGLIFEHVDNIGPWNRDQFLFFAAFMLTIDQIHMTFISANFWQFSYDLRVGNLDFILLKPIGAIFIVFFRRFRPSTFFNFFVTFSCLVYFGQKADVSALMWSLMPVFLVLSLTLLVSLEILITMLMFVTIESFGINFLRMQFQNLSRYPDFVYKLIARRIFTVIFPILLVGSAPVTFVFDHSEWHLLAGAAIATSVAIALVNFCWKWGLKTYESASS